MAKQHLYKDQDIRTAPDGVHTVGGGTLPSTALEIHIRNGGKSKHGYFRYNGTPFGEKRTERIALGSYDQHGLTKLRHDCVACEKLIEQGRSPKQHLEREKERLRKAGMTLRQAMDEFYEHGRRKLWNDGTCKYNERVRRKHIEPVQLMDWPIETIRAVDIDEAFGKIWRATTGLGPRVRSLLCSTFQFQMDKDDGAYRGPNPASWRKNSSLSRIWGTVLSEPLAGPHWQDMPKIVAYLYGPMDHWVPGYLTVPQAAYAFERNQKAIKAHQDHGNFKGVIYGPRMWRAVSCLIPIHELKRVLGEPKREPKPIPHESAQLYAQVCVVGILTAVRIGMVCRLRWRNVKWDQGYMEFLGKRPGIPSEHKLGWKYPKVPYIVMLTDNVRAILEERRKLSIEHGLKVGPDDFVFRHLRTRFGRDQWYGKPANHPGAEDYVKKAVARLNDQGANIRIIPEGKKVTAHGARMTFTTWAKECGANFGHGYSDEMINLTLGHTIPAIRENKTNWHYFYEIKLLDARRKMMDHYERHCLSLRDQLPQTNIVPLPVPQRQRKRR